VWGDFYYLFNYKFTKAFSEFLKIWLTFDRIMVLSPWPHFLGPPCTEGVNKSRYTLKRYSVYNFCSINILIHDRKANFSDNMKAIKSLILRKEFEEKYNQPYTKYRLQAPSM